MGEDERRVRGRELYLDSERDLGATFFFGGYRGKFGILHGDYSFFVPSPSSGKGGIKNGYPSSRKRWKSQTCRN